MKKLVDWSKANIQFLILLGLILFVFSNRPSLPIPLLRNSAMYNESFSGADMMGAPSMSLNRSYKSNESTNLNVAQDQRMTVDDNYLSLKVENVNKALGDIKQKTEEFKGFVVNSHVSKPEESTVANITVRVPKENSNDLQAYIKGLAVKVVTENNNSNDVTDQYRDLEAEMSLYLANKVKFEELMSKAVIVQDILQIQNELLNIQRQIDSVKGQKQYIEQTANSVKFSVYLSTDEYSLPYVPDTSWRPNAVFKESVRSLVLTFRELGNKVIWLTVYSVIWAPTLLVIIYLKKRSKGKK